jgi:hypothetical protein
MKFLLVTALLLPALVSASGSKTKKYLITITNLTKAQVMTMPVVALHNPSSPLFEVGKPAGPGLTLLAEDGGTDTLEDELRSRGRRNVDVYIAGDNNIMPGKSVQILIKTKNASKVRLSLATMLATTNDTFVAAMNIRLPSRFKELDLTAYDAGTEFNSESCEKVPGPPCGSHGARDTANAEGIVTESNGLTGSGDIDLETYGFEGSPAKIKIELLK